MSVWVPAPHQSLTLSMGSCATWQVQESTSPQPCTGPPSLPGVIGKSFCHSPSLHKFGFHTAGDTPWAAGQSPLLVCGCRWGPSGYSYIDNSRWGSLNLAWKCGSLLKNCLFVELFWIMKMKNQEKPITFLLQNSFRLCFQGPSGLFHLS